MVLYVQELYLNRTFSSNEHGQGIGGNRLRNQGACVHFWQCDWHDKLATTDLFIVINKVGLSFVKLSKMNKSLFTGKCKLERCKGCKNVSDFFNIHDICI